MNARTNTFNFPFRETNNHQAYQPVVKVSFLFVYGLM